MKSSVQISRAAHHVVETFPGAAAAYYGPYYTGSD